MDYNPSKSRSFLKRHMDFLAAEYIKPLEDQLAFLQEKVSKKENEYIQKNEELEERITLSTEMLQRVTEQLPHIEEAFSVLSQETEENTNKIKKQIESSLALQRRQKAQLDELNSWFNCQCKKYNSNAHECQKKLLEVKNDFERRLFQLEENMRANNERLNREDYQSIIQTTNELKEDIFALKDALESLRIFIAKSKPLEEPIKGTYSPPLSEKSESTCQIIDYFDFENHFRGSRETIKKRQEIYLPHFMKKKNVLDLGCGRGEFVELLLEHGINVCGVDSYPDFVQYCKIRNLPVIAGDALEVLEYSTNIDGIFAGQLIEHLTFSQLEKLCKMSFEKLSNDGTFIIETPNPMSLAIYTHAFYMDPSHVKPVHPLTLQYMLQKSGFRDVQILFLEGSKLPIQIPQLVIEQNDSVDKFNQTMKIVSDTLFGSQDYAVVAQK